MTETRTTSSTGGEKGVKPERFDLMPPTGLAAIARVYAFGAEKYADHNWRKGYEWGKSIASLERHTQAFKNGETYDFCPADCPKEAFDEASQWFNVDGRTCPDHSGLEHIAHAGFHVLALLTWREEQGEGVDNPFDDRWPFTLERARRADAEAKAPVFENLGPVDVFIPRFELDDVEMAHGVARLVGRAVSRVFDKPRPFPGEDVPRPFTEHADRVVELTEKGERAARYVRHGGTLQDFLAEVGGVDDEPVDGVQRSFDGPTAEWLPGEGEVGYIPPTEEMKHL